MTTTPWQAASSPSTPSPTAWREAVVESLRDELIRFPDNYEESGWNEATNKAIAIIKELGGDNGKAN